MFSPQTLIVGRPIYAKDRDCGYCHGQKQNSYPLKSYREHYRDTDSPQSITIGMSLENVSLADYETLCNKGFRRSGDFLYKPDLLRNCCRLYTIRTSYGMLKLNKDQRKAINKFMKQLTGEEVKRQGSLDLYEEFGTFEKNIDKKVFRTEFDGPEFTNEKFELYKKYQISVHKDDPKKLTKSSFKRFLCDSPFHNTGTNEGHVHELYYINDKLAAIAVLDILPDGISSVYFIWDPDHYKMGLGKISSLREIILTKKLRKKWYYMGFFIPDCEKMKYKSKFGGELLDISDYKYYAIQDLHERDILNEQDNLFIIGDANDDQEKFIGSENLFGSRPIDDHDYNVVEQIYSYGNVTYQASERARSNLDFYQGNDLRNELYNIPDVVPGLIPFRQLASSEEKLKKLDINIYDPFASGIRKYRFRASPVHDKVVVDLVRLLGFEILDHSVIVIY